MWSLLVMVLKNALNYRGEQTGEKRMKTLKVLSTGWLTKMGTDVGFFMKSLKTKKIFQVVSKTPSGNKFVIVLAYNANGTKVTNGEEYIVSGDEARYELFSANGGRIAELEAQITKLEGQRDNLEAEIDELSNTLADLVDGEAV